MKPSCGNNEETGNWNTVYKWKYKDCNKIMERTWNMIDHARMHQGIKPYKCDKWGRWFTQKGNMRKHTKLHLTNNVDQRRKYPWEFCGKLYTEKYNLMVSKLFSKNTTYVYLFKFEKNFLCLIHLYFITNIMKNNKNKIADLDSLKIIS